MIENDTRPGPPNSTMLICPVNDCPWRHQRTRPAVLFGGDVFAAIKSADAVDEAVCRAHLAEHSILEFARTIANLREQLATVAVLP